jgi:hypothetical protein
MTANGNNWQDYYENDSIKEMKIFIIPALNRSIQTMLTSSTKGA